MNVLTELRFARRWEIRRQGKRLSSTNDSYVSYTNAGVAPIILPVVLYVCETWSLTLREERRLRVFENRVLRRVFGLKSDEVTGEWRKLHKRSLVICTPYPILCGW